MDQRIRNHITYAWQYVRRHTASVIVAALIIFFIVLASSVNAQAAATLTFTATPTSGASPLTVRLDWAATGVSTCTATGGWSGVKAISGTQTLTGVLANTTYGLTCSASNATATLTWSAPTTNTDGTALTNLTNYRIFASSSSAGVATATPVTIAAPASTYTVAGLAPGVMYFGVKAVNSAGAESVLSNIASKTLVAETVSRSVDVTVTKVPSPPTGVTVTDVLVYDTTYKRGQFMLGKVVGRAVIGTACYEDFQLQGGYYRVRREDVTFDTPAAERKTNVPVAKCA